MNISLNPEAPLAQLYRQARALASEETARPEEAVALSEAGTSAFPDLVAQGGRGPGRWASAADRRRDQVRRAVIAALRHQALMARRAWVQQRESSADGDPPLEGLLRQAATLAEAALRLHREGDAGRNETEYVLYFLRATSAVAAAPAKKPLPAARARTEPQPGVAPPDEPQAAAAAQPESAESPPSAATRPPIAAPSPAAAPAAGPPAPAAPSPVQIASPIAAATAAPPDIVVVGLPSEPLSEKKTARPARPRPAVRSASAPRLRPALVGGLAVIAVIGFAAGVVTAPRLLGTKERPTQTDQPRTVALPASSAQPSRTPAPAATPAPSVAVQPAAVPKVTPSVAPRPTPPPVARSPARPAARTVAVPAPGQVTLDVRSDPSGAQVYVQGVLQGTTPLSIYARPGSVIAVVVRRGSRVWRGIVQVGQASPQVVTVRLPQPPPAVAQAPRKPAPTATPAPTPTVVNIRAHYDGLMAKGVELYQAGWYGPAMARFKQAVAVVPTPRAYLWLGRAAIKAGRHAEARRALERVVALAPGTDAAREAQQLLNRLKLAERGT